MDKTVLFLASIREKNDNDLPDAKYTRISEKLLHAIPSAMACSMACGGKNCKWENGERWPEKDQALKGIYSSWVLDNVIAMARPSDELIENHQLIEQFKKHNITSIINLQRPGEHASCGPALLKESLFTYDPKRFMDNDIFFYNFGWKDFGVASLDTILDMVKVMAFALSEGKVAVHCHAGLGRTGVLIACYLIYAFRMDSFSAVTTVRKHRPNSVQTRSQLECVKQFALFIKPLRIIFPQVVPNSPKMSLDNFLRRQSHLLHGLEAREFKHLPKLIKIICDRLTQIATTAEPKITHVRKQASAGTIRSRGNRDKLKRCNTIDFLRDSAPSAFVNEMAPNTKNDHLVSQNVDAILSPRITRRRSLSSIADLNMHHLVGVKSMVDASLVVKQEFPKSSSEKIIENGDIDVENDAGIIFQLSQTKSQSDLVSEGLNLNNNNLSVSTEDLLLSNPCHDVEVSVEDEIDSSVKSSVGTARKSGTWVNVINDVDGTMNEKPSIAGVNDESSRPSSKCMITITPATPIPNTSLVNDCRDHDIEIIEMPDEVRPTTNTRSTDSNAGNGTENMEEKEASEECLMKGDSDVGLMYRAEATQQMLDKEGDSNDMDHVETEIEATDVQVNNADIHNHLKKYATAVVEENHYHNNNKSSTIRKLTQSMFDLRQREFGTSDDVMSESNSTDDMYANSSTCGSAKHRIKDPITVAMALAYKLTSDEYLWEKVYTKQVELNTRESAMDDLVTEGDAHLLSCLMWSWLEHLQQPILSLDRVTEAFQQSDVDFHLFVNSQEKAVVSTLNCILQCVLSLPHLTAELKLSILKRCVTACVGHSVTQNVYDNMVKSMQQYIYQERKKISHKSLF